MASKPPYSIPSTADILGGPRNGLTAASTFVGGGGSDLGITWAGFSVRWANEFDAMARESYRANFTDHPVDGRDIREVSGADILATSGLAPGALDLLNGSPPCQAFSMAGKRQRDWGDKAVGLDKGRRKDDLFFEFARLLGELQPRAFMAENVKGLVTGKAKGYFLEIFAALVAAGYRVHAKVLDAQWMGVPQARQRLIFVGFRSDAGIDPRGAFPEPLPYRYSVRDACPWIETRAMPGSGLPTDASTPRRLRPSKTTADAFNVRVINPGAPSGTVTCESADLQTAERRQLTIGELRRICGFPDDYALVGSYAEQWKRLGNAVPPPMARGVAAGIARELVRHDAGGMVEFGEGAPRVA